MVLVRVRDGLGAIRGKRRSIALARCSVALNPDAQVGALRKNVRVFLKAAAGFFRQGAGIALKKRWTQLTGGRAGLGQNADFFRCDGRAGGKKNTRPVRSPTGGGTSSSKLLEAVDVFFELALSVGGFVLMNDSFGSEAVQVAFDVVQ